MFFFLANCDSVVAVHSASDQNALNTPTFYHDIGMREKIQHTK